MKMTEEQRLAARKKTNEWLQTKKDNGTFQEYVRAKNLKTFYQMTVEDYDSMLDKQNGVCAICKSPPGEKRLGVDHDWKCCPSKFSCGNCVRGLLCFNCNTTLAN